MSSRWTGICHSTTTTYYS